MKYLTEKQKKILSFIEIRLEQNYSPSQREIADHFNLAQNAVYQHIRYLKEKGYMDKTSVHRGLRLSDEYLAQKEKQKGLPLVGRVAAGEPILAEQNIEDYITVPEIIAKSGKNAFLLKVRGDSMVDDGILNNDIVVVDPDSRVENGQIGVVLLDDEATVKRVLFQKKRIALKPANQKYQTRYITETDKQLRIVGKVVGCFRAIR